ncbi:MAG: hypothetical protein R3345_11145, partial [Fulvivirga sp.]|nr:hypothetical protein [Fulvivirga sp.]
MKRYLLFLPLVFISLLAFSQPKPERLNKVKKIVCYADNESKGTRIYPRNLLKNGTLNRTQSANIEVTYNGFSEEAMQAFQFAVDIWAGLIDSPVTIRIDATWQSLEDGVLGSAIWGTAFRNFEGAKEDSTWYPVALAEKMAGRELNDPAEPDIIANFNSNANWYLGTNANPGSNQFDLVSVVLHEIGHGLGFVDSFGYSNGIGGFGLGETSFPFIFDLSVQNGSDVFLTTFENPSEALGDQLTSRDVFFNSPTAIKVTGEMPELFAPLTWNPGSSIAHLDEVAYGAGDENSLMTPQIGRDEAMHDPGPMTLNMFGDMGWEYTYIIHDRLTNTENFAAASYPVTAVINSDIEYESDSVILFYSLDGFNTDTTKVFMSPTANVDEFSAEINSNNLEGQTYSYFIQVADTNSRDFTRPSLAPDFFYTFTTAVDTEPPVITHDSPNFVKASDTELVLQATVKDFLGLASVEVEYFINNQPGQLSPMTLIDEFDSLYQTSIDLSGVTLQEGDSIRYKITAVDDAAASNTTVFPADGLIKLNVVALKPAVVEYVNDFNDPVTAEDDFFFSNNFRIETPASFDNAAIHSDHPYMDGTGPNDESNYVYEMRVPIILNANEALMTFDEIVLVEPGEAGTDFGDAQFWDYVIIEGSKDGGTTWIPFEDGYDSRAQEDWETLYNSDIVDNNSQATGEPSLYRSRTIDMLANGSFTGGEEILIRFRLFADQAAHGWGWAIDNLEVQVDKKPPLILHDHVDYLTSNTSLELTANVTDNFGVDSVAYVTTVNGQEQPIIGFPANQTDTYSVIFDVSALSVGDTIRYQIVAFDT